MTDEELRLECLKLATKQIQEAGVRGFGQLQEEYSKDRIEKDANRFFKYVKNGYNEVEDNKQEDVPPPEEPVEEIISISQIEEKCIENKPNNSNHLKLTFKIAITILIVSSVLLLIFKYFAV